MNLIHVSFVSFCVQARVGAFGPTSTTFLFALLLFTWNTIFMAQFQGRRSIGILMLTIYLIYLLFCTLAEFEVMHPYGTDHNDDDKIWKVG